MSNIRTSRFRTARGGEPSGSPRDSRQPSRKAPTPSPYLRQDYRSPFSRTRTAQGPHICQQPAGRGNEPGSGLLAQGTQPWAPTCWRHFNKCPLGNSTLALETVGKPSGWQKAPISPWLPNSHPTIFREQSQLPAWGSPCPHPDPVVGSGHSALTTGSGPGMWFGLINQGQSE